MVSIFNLSLHREERYRQPRTIINGGYLKQKISTIARRALRLLCKHQSILALAGFSYLLIEVGTMASELTFGEKYVADLDSCRNLLCSELNKLDSSRKIPPHIESQCHPDSPQSNSLSLFRECLSDLCEYMHIIGKKFYACSDMVGKNLSKFQSLPVVDSVESTEAQSNFTLELWNKLCPKKIFRKKDKLKELAYLNRCIKKVCRHSAISKVKVDNAIMNWCNTASINKLYKLLKNLTKILDESQKKNPDEWTQANIIGTLVTAVAGVVVGVTSVIGTIITCKAAKAASSMARTIPSLTSGLQSIVTGTTETTRAILEAGGAVEAEVIPMETLQVLSQISETISQSFSYYSIEELPLESGNFPIETSLGGKTIDTPLNPSLENLAPAGESIGGAVLDSVGAAAGSVGSAIEGAAGTIAGGTLTKVVSIGGSLLGGIGISTISKTGKSPYENKVEQSVTTAKIEQIEKIKQNYVDDIVGEASEIDNITKEHAFRLQSSLLDWNNSFCFFEFPNLICRLPSPRHLMERMIRVPLENLRKIFSENLSGLCYSLGKDLWCNWTRFFDILSIERNMTQNNDTCPWDQFLLCVKENSHNLYQITSSLRESGCYNETVMIKV